MRALSPFQNSRLKLQLVTDAARAGRIAQAWSASGEDGFRRTTMFEWSDSCSSFVLNAL